MQAGQGVEGGGWSVATSLADPSQSQYLTMTILGPVQLLGTLKVLASDRGLLNLVSFVSL